MEKEYKNGIFLFLGMIFLLFLHYYLTNLVETKMYPYEKEWFSLSFNYHSNNMSCISISPIFLTYFNNNRLVRGLYSKNIVLLEFYIERKCPFNKTTIWLSATNLTSVYIDDRLNLTQKNQTGNESFEIYVKYNYSEIYHQTLKIYLSIDKDFFNYYSFQGSEKVFFWIINLEYKNNIFDGYSADESSFFILEGNTKKDEPIFKGKYKRYEFNESSSILLRFNPKSKFLLLIQKILDSLILGIIAVLIYELPWLKFIQFISKLYKSIKQRLYMEIKTKVKKEIVHTTIKDFLEKNSLNLVALSVFLLVTISLSSHEGALSHQLGVLSAGVSYFLIIDLIRRDTGKESITFGIMKAFIVFFAILFCIWVILNLVIPFQSKFNIVILILWLIFILGVPIKLYIS